MLTNASLPACGSVLVELDRSLGHLLLLCGFVLLASPLAAQPRMAESVIAGVGLPVAANDWSSDADGSKAATLDLAASLAGSECEAREALAWSAADQAAAENIRTPTESAFETAGWALMPVSRTSEGQSILLARRDSERFVMVWRPEEKEIGLLLCRIEPAAPAMAEAPAPEQLAPAAPSPDGAAKEAETSTPAVDPRIDDDAEPEAATAPRAAVGPVEENPAAADSAANLWLRLLAFGLLILGGVGLIVRDFRARALSVEWQWPTAAATVERGWVEEDERSDAAGNPVSTYMPMLRYRYRVDGEEFQGGNIGLDDQPLRSAEAAVGLLSKYPDFATVEIRYDPEDPSFAVIEAMRPPPGREFYFGLGAILLALAVIGAHLL